MTLRPQAFLIILAPLLLAPLLHAQWNTPTPEELSMTSQPEVPGASAVYLFREQLDNDVAHYSSTYVRIKVLTEAGKRYATVELPFVAGNGEGINITDIAGRTIHPDGTVVPFTGKPYLKLIEKRNGSKIMSKVFSLPDVQTGSILEYRFKRRNDDSFYFAPIWFVQTELFTRKAHFYWNPGYSAHIAYLPLLPAGVTVKLPQPGYGVSDLEVANLMPASTEEFLPPLAALSYRVFFYYTNYKSQEEFWTNEGSAWSAILDKFIGPTPAIRAAVEQLVSPADTPLIKLQKIYGAVMALENTDFTRQRTDAESKTASGHTVESASDVLAQKLGSGEQLTELFVAMARAAGLKAYIAAVTNRDGDYFLKGYLSFGQFDDYLAIVNLDGNDLYFDPGQRYIPFNHLAWQHTLAAGIRQSDNGVTFLQTPNESFKANSIQRSGDLQLAADGAASGTVTFVFKGASALGWRQQFLTGDNQSLRKDIATFCQEKLGKDVEATVESIQNLVDYEQPLSVTLSIHGKIATRAGSRMLLAADPFEANSEPVLSAKQRTYSVYFRYGHVDQDGLRIHLPPGYRIESMPTPLRIPYHQAAVYNFATDQTPDTYTIHRDLVQGEIVLPLGTC